MKPDIHPKYELATINCACGASYETRTTRGAYSIDVCSQCHPFFTGKARIMDTAGRVEKFKTKYTKKTA
jgi:large subunit ribosomal protein L31